MTEGNSKEFEMAVGTSTVLVESGIMEGENFYAPIESVNEGESTSQSNWDGAKNDTGLLCRSCANSSDYLIPIYEGEGLEHELELKIQKHLPIQVSSTDTLPLQLCYRCASTLLAWDTMFSGCLEAEKKLRAMQEVVETKTCEVFEDTHMEEGTEIIDSDDEPLITSKAKLMSEKNKPTPIKKKILSTAKNKNESLKNEKTAIDFKEEDKERIWNEEFILDGLLENELVDVKKTMGNSPKKLFKKFDVDKKSSKPKKKLNAQIDVTSLVDEKGINSIIQEASRLRHTKMLRRNSMKGVAQTFYIECVFCQKTVKRDTITEHMIQEHGLTIKSLSEDRSIKCHDCEKTFGNLNILEKHIESVHERVVKAICEICDKTFTDTSNYKQHLLIHTGEKSFICQICGKGFVQPQGLRMHMPSHSDSYPFSCSLCPKKFRRKQHYELHLAKHTGKKTHQCETCGKFFSTKSELKMHSWIHKNEWPYVCNHCNKGFNQSCGLRLHLNNHHHLGS